MRLITIIFFLSFILFTVFGCGIRKELREERKIWEYANWKQEFKDRALCLCVLQGLNNTSVQDSIIKYDKSFYNPLANAIFDSTINEILKTEVQQMQLDSANSIGRVPADISNLLEGKRVMNHCTAFYRSKRLDSLANIEKENWRRISNIMDKIHDKLPTF